MVRFPGEASNDPSEEAALAAFGRYAGPATLILSSLADGTKHGYALTKDIEAFAAVRLAPRTLYEALARLELRGLDGAGSPALTALDLGCEPASTSGSPLSSAAVGRSPEAREGFGALARGARDWRDSALALPAVVSPSAVLRRRRVRPVEATSVSQ